jgi:SpoVK/Ycf46/Vps4 family AAA+-type ATPase
MPLSGKRSRAPVFLLYGPPGTSKTTFVHGIASHMGWDLVTLSPSDFIADSLDRIEFRAREIFEDLGSLDECVILLDEMDSLLRDREILADKSAGTIMEFVVPALLPKLQQLRDYTLDKRIAVFFVSNYYESIDAAIRRSGRIDTRLQVLPYGREARAKVLARLVKRDLPNLGKAERIKLMKYVNKLPCNLVYRDLESLVQAVVPAASTLEVTDALNKISPSLGISPEIYNPGRRRKAHGEFCAMLARLLDAPDPLLDPDPPQDVAREFILGKMSELKKYPEWQITAEAWVDELRQ